MTRKNGKMKRKTRLVVSGDLEIGGNSRITIQSMTNTLTKDVWATLSQIKALHESGCDFVRVSVPDKESAQALKKIITHSPVPLIADIHFDHELAIKSIETGVPKIRINPGNISDKNKIDKIIKAILKNGTALRIGVNSGSLEKNLLTLYEKDPPFALAQSAEKWVDYFSSKGVEKIIVSIKSSSVPVTVKANEIFARKNDIPLHLGVTEAGTVKTGTIVSSVGLGILLWNGIGDTIRVSLSGNPVEEVTAAKQILSSLGIRDDLPRVIACPTCARCCYDVIGISKRIENKLKKIKKPITVAVMGCVVNGPGEAKEADIGIAGGKNTVLLFKKGAVKAKISKESAEKILWQEIKKLVTSR